MSTVVFLSSLGKMVSGVSIFVGYLLIRFWQSAIEGIYLRKLLFLVKEIGGGGGSLFSTDFERAAILMSEF